MRPGQMVTLKNPNSFDWMEDPRFYSEMRFSGAKKIDRITQSGYVQLMDMPGVYHPKWLNIGIAQSDIDRIDDLEQRLYDLEQIIFEIRDSCNEER